ncbi:hypothetical protein J6590_099976 [Homalodisca vitripennis]|nr:hypothetical protein J6590_099976 [Homalodisca vitripennis]
MAALGRYVACVARHIYINATTRLREGLMHLSITNNATPPAPLPSPLQHPPPPPRPPATTPQPMGEQQAPHLTRAMADERWRTVSWRMNKNLCLRRPISEPGPLRMRDCRADHWTTETSCAWRRDMAVRAARGARRYRRSAVVS